MKKKIKVLLVDDHPMIRHGVRSCLKNFPSIRVIGEASDGVEALRKAKKLRPDVVLMDISMPRMNGLEATAVLHKTVPSAKVIMLSVHENKAYILELVRAGGKGYLLKDSPPEEFPEAIEAVYKGQTYFSSGISQMVLNEYVGKGKSPGKSTSGQMISRREQEVLSLIAEGFSNKEIAQRLFVSVRTVETHREHIMKKLDIHSTAGLTRYAVAAGLIRAKVILNSPH